MENFNVLYSEQEIQDKIALLAEQLDNEYKGKELVIISILKGALYFTIDLTKKMKTPIIFETIHAHSYEGTESTGFDKIRQFLLSKNPNSLKIAVLADKKERRIVDVPIDYSIFDIPNKFIIGYGFDYDEKYRNLPYIAYIE